MGNPNKVARTILRWTHLLIGFLIGVWMWQRTRLRRLYRLLRQRPRPDKTNGPKPSEDTHRNTPAH